MGFRYAYFLPPGGAIAADIRNYNQASDFGGINVHFRFPFCYILILGFLSI